MLARKLLRTALGYKAQFISMIVMVTIGMGIFVGFNAEWKTIEVNTAKFLRDTGYADYRVYSQSMLGFTARDLAAVEALEGVERASRFLSVNVDVQGAGRSLALTVVEKYGVSGMEITAGAQYDPESDGIWLSDRFAAANGISLGDELTLAYMGREITGPVVGLAKSGEYMVCVADSNQLMPDYTLFGFAYITPKRLKAALGMEYYSQIHILSGRAKSDLEPRIQAALGSTSLVLSKDEHLPYAEAMGEVEEGKVMGSILPALFLLIAILAMVTTMHRIAANEKTQIGALKCLGFRDRRILRHYTSYGFFIGLAGTLLGAGMGYSIAYMIMNPNGMMGTYLDMTHWFIVMPWFCYAAMAATALLLALISFLSVRKMLRGTAADALRPYVPKISRRTLMERSRLWDRLPFGAQWNLRDVLRHKSRSAMTLVGVAGCMVLLVGGLGMMDTMNGFLDSLENQVCRYAVKLTLAANAGLDEVEALSAQVHGDWQAAVPAELDGEAISVEIYHVERDMIRFLREDNRPLSLDGGGAYICLRLASRYSVGDEITFSPYGSDQSYTVRVAGVQRSLTAKNIVMTRDCADALGLPYTPAAIYTGDTDIPDSPLIASTQTKQALMDSYRSFIQIMYAMVLLLVLSAVALGIVVLYNLGVMSYIERYRELATLKVIGFRDRHIGRILISQNVWLTALGAILGLPLGLIALRLLLTALASEYELSLVVGAPTFCVSVLVTFGVSLAVGLMIARKNRFIDMVAALKAVE